MTRTQHTPRRALAQILCVVAAAAWLCAGALPCDAAGLSFALPSTAPRREAPPADDDGATQLDTIEVHAEPDHLALVKHNLPCFGACDDDFVPERIGALRKTLRFLFSPEDMNPYIDPAVKVADEVRRSAFRKDKLP